MCTLLTAIYVKYIACVVLSALLEARHAMLNSVLNGLRALWRKQASGAVYDVSKTSKDGQGCSSRGGMGEEPDLATIQRRISDSMRIGTVPTESVPSRAQLLACKHPSSLLLE